MKLAQLREIEDIGFNSPDYINVMARHFDALLDVVEAAEALAVDGYSKTVRESALTKALAALEAVE